MALELGSLSLANCTKRSRLQSKPAIDISTVLSDTVLSTTVVLYFSCFVSAVGNESEVGKALNESMELGLVRRDQLFITSKLWNTYHKRERVAICLQKTLDALQLDYLDLYLVHWPLGYAEGDVEMPRNEAGQVMVSDIDYLETYQGMEEAFNAGKVKSIGISNFNSEQIGRLLSVAKVKPAVLQVECHPYLNQSKLIEFCRKHQIQVTGKVGSIFS